MASHKRRRCNGSSGGPSAEQTAKAFDAPKLRKPGTVCTLALTQTDGSPFSCRLGSIFDRNSDPSLLGDGNGGLFLTKANAVWWMRSTSQNMVELLAGSAGGVAGDSDGVGPAAGFDDVCHMALNQDAAVLYVVDRNNNKIKQIDLATAAVSTIVGSTDGFANGVGAAAKFHSPGSIALDTKGTNLYVTDGDNNCVRRVQLATCTVSTLAVVIECPFSIVLGPGDTHLYVLNFTCQVRRIELASGTVSVLAGSGTQGFADGIGAQAQFKYLYDLVLAPNGASLFVTDYHNHRVRRVELDSGTVSTFAGNKEEGTKDGVGIAAQLSKPAAICVWKSGGALAVIEQGGTIRSITLPTSIPTIPPSTFAADMSCMMGDEMLPQGLATFVVGAEKQRIEHVTKSILCVRSKYFSTMFRGEMAEASAAEIIVPDTSLKAFKVLLKYLVSDAAAIDPLDTPLCLEVLMLAEKYQAGRLLLLVRKAMADAVQAETAVPFLEAADVLGDESLFAQCRSFIAAHPAEVRRGGGVEQLRDLGIAKGLLADSMDEVTRLRSSWHSHA